MQIQEKDGVQCGVVDTHGTPEMSAAFLTIHHHFYDSHFLQALPTVNLVVKKKNPVLFCFDYPTSLISNKLLKCEHLRMLSHMECEKRVRLLASMAVIMS